LLAEFFLSDKERNATPPIYQSKLTLGVAVRSDIGPGVAVFTVFLPYEAQLGMVGGAL
jgi:hypothetical protein